MNELLEKAKYTLQDFYPKLKETIKGLFTVRLTPCNMQENIAADQVAETLEIIAKKNDNIKKILCFEEGSDKGQVARHYHMRFVTDYKDRKSMSDVIKANFPIGDKGNRAYSLRKCQGKDKTLWKSATYIAKQGNLVFQVGYTEHEIAELINVGRRLAVTATTPIYKQIICIYKLDDIPDLMPSYLLDIIEAYYKENNKAIPQLYQLKALMHNILYACNTTYRKRTRSQLIQEYGELCDPSEPHASDYY